MCVRVCIWSKVSWFIPHRHWINVEQIRFFTLPPPPLPFPLIPLTINFYCVWPLCEHNKNQKSSLLTTLSVDSLSNLAAQCKIQSRKSHLEMCQSGKSHENLHSRTPNFHYGVIQFLELYTSCVDICFIEWEFISIPSFIFRILWNCECDHGFFIEQSQWCHDAGCDGNNQPLRLWMKGSYRKCSDYFLLVFVCNFRAVAIIWKERHFTNAMNIIQVCVMYLCSTHYSCRTVHILTHTHTILHLYGLS